MTDLGARPRCLGAMALSLGVRGPSWRSYGFEFTRWKHNCTTLIAQSSDEEPPWQSPAGAAGRASPPCTACIPNAVACERPSPNPCARRCLTQRRRHAPTPTNRPARSATSPPEGGRTNSLPMPRNAHCPATAAPHSSGYRTVSRTDAPPPLPTAATGCHDGRRGSQLLEAMLEHAEENGGMLGGGHGDSAAKVECSRRKRV